MGTKSPQAHSRVLSTSPRPRQDPAAMSLFSCIEKLHARRNMSFYIDIIDFDAGGIDRYHRRDIAGAFFYWLKALAHLCIWEY